MEKQILVGIVGILFVTVVLCGCQAGQVTNDYSDVFQSNVVRLVNYTLEFERDKTSAIVGVSVTGRISNLFNRTVNIEIIAEFYDKDNRLLGNTSIFIYGLQPKGQLGSSTGFPPPYLSYAETDV